MIINTFFDFCSGIGGGRLGLEQCGLKCVGYADTSRLSVTTYNLMHDARTEHNWGNIRKIKEETLPDFDILIAGFPCQSFSVIGRKEGLNDPRGQLIYHLARIISYKQPKFFILENVKGLVNHNKGQSLADILKLLTQCGYDVIYKVLNSIDYGVPQMRQRIYFLGIQKKLQLNITKFKWPEKVQTPKLDLYLTGEKDLSIEYFQSFKHYLQNETNKGIYTPEDFIKRENLIIDTRMSDLRLYEGRVPTLRSQRDGIIYIKNGKYKDLTGYEALLLQGFPKELANKVKYNVSNRHLLMQAGNAMTVPVIKEIGQCILIFSKTNSIDRGDSTMKKTWKEYEEECSKYLNLKYPNASFEVTGGSDSTVSDIKACIKGKTIYIEAKEPSSQCGQFVLFPDMENKTFTFSSKNKSDERKAKPFINYMAQYFNAYSNPDTTGMEINIDKKIIYDWITYYYKNTKKAKYFITGEIGQYIIFPISSFQNYFDVKATYRVKKSGSRDVSKTILNRIQNRILDINGVKKCYFEGQKTHVIADNILAKTKYIIDDIEIYFSPESSQHFILKQTSRTANANVIFSISLKSNQIDEDINVFNKEFR